MHMPPACIGTAEQPGPRPFVRGGAVGTFSFLPPMSTRPTSSHRSTTVVSGDGSVTVAGLPFPTGQEVEVIVVPAGAGQDRADVHESLRGSVTRFERPFEPAAGADDWDVA